MTAFVLIVHLLIAIALVGIVLLQRSEGGALGIGGGGGFMTGRGATNAITRVTALLALCFFITSILLTLLANGGGGGGSILEDIVDVAPAESESVLPPLDVPGSEPAPPEPQR